MAIPSERHAVDAARLLAHDALVTKRRRPADTEGRKSRLAAAAEYARRARGERKRPRHGWASLTPTEQQSSSLVADGLTNPEIARRLLITKLDSEDPPRHIFAKLGIRSRAELAAELFRH